MTDSRPAPGPIWAAIAETLSGEIAAGLWQPGDKLPTEARLSARFGVNRQTLRRALAALAERGILAPRQGAGVFVSAPPLAYPLGRRVRLSAALAAAGIQGERRLLGVEERRAEAREAEALGLATGAPVVASNGLRIVSGAPLALYTAVYPAARLPGIAEALRREATVTAALAACGVADYTRARTEIAAVEADAVQARHLGLRPGAALLRSRALNVDSRGAPVEWGTTWFSGARISLTLDADPQGPQ